MKLSVKIEYLTPLEFISQYAKRNTEAERKNIEKACKMSLLEIIGELAEEPEHPEILDQIIPFANELDYNYCTDHNIFYTYDACPFCTFDIENIWQV